MCAQNQSTEYAADVAAAAVAAVGRKEVTPRRTANVFCASGYSSDALPVPLLCVLLLSVAFDVMFTDAGRFPGRLCDSN